jgi:hypothetical protein
VGGDLPEALNRLQTIRVHPLDPPTGWTDPAWLDLTAQPLDMTPLQWEHTLDYWVHLHEVIDSEPPLEAFGAHYGDLAVLGIVKGKPFAPDARMRHILEEAAEIGNAQMRVQSFADRRPDRVVWPDRQWQWAALRAPADHVAPCHVCGAVIGIDHVAVAIRVRAHDQLDLRDGCCWSLLSNPRCHSSGGRGLGVAHTDHAHQWRQLVFWRVCCIPTCHVNQLDWTAENFRAQILIDCGQTRDSRRLVRGCVENSARISRLYIREQRR